MSTKPQTRSNILGISFLTLVAIITRCLNWVPCNNRSLFSQGPRGWLLRSKCWQGRALNRTFRGRSFLVLADLQKATDPWRHCSNLTSIFTFMLFSLQIEPQYVAHVGLKFVIFQPQLSEGWDHRAHGTALDCLHR